MDCFGTYITHVQTCEKVRVQSASHAMDCFGTCTTHVQTCDNVRFQCPTHWTASVHALNTFQTCDNVLVQSAMQWTASVHTLHMSKPVIMFVSKCYAMDCFGTYFAHAQTCHNVRVQSCSGTIQMTPKKGSQIVMGIK